MRRERPPRRLSHQVPESATQQGQLPSTCSDASSALVTADDPRNPGTRCLSELIERPRACRRATRSSTTWTAVRWTGSPETSIDPRPRRCLRPARAAAARIRAAAPARPACRRMAAATAAAAAPGLPPCSSRRRRRPRLLLSPSRRWRRRPVRRMAPPRRRTPRRTARPTRRTAPPMRRPMRCAMATNAAGHPTSTATDARQQELRDEIDDSHGAGCHGGRELWPRSTPSHGSQKRDEAASSSWSGAGRRTCIGTSPPIEEP